MYFSVGVAVFLAITASAVDAVQSQRLRNGFRPSSSRAGYTFNHQHHHIHNHKFCAAGPASTDPSTSTEAPTLYCQAPPSYGEHSLTSFNATKLNYEPGEQIQLYCAKYSSFHSGDLILGGFTTNSPPTDQERFGSVNLTCSDAGVWQPTPANAPRCVDFVNCLRTPRGGEYIGTLNQTISGRRCRNWNEPTMSEWKARFTDPALLYWWSSHTHNIISSGRIFATGNLQDQRNYCRNPNNDTAPWCFVENTEGTENWEYCSTVPQCLDMIPFQCSFTASGRDYLGTLNKSQKGWTCYPWHIPGMTLYRQYFRALLLDGHYPGHSFCRDPGRHAGYYWCWTSSTSDEHWDYCSTPPSCPGYP